MPNGWHPVSGLDVVLINRTEQRHYPRHEWNHARNWLWATRFFGANGFAPVGEFQFTPEESAAPVDQLIREVQKFAALDATPDSESASALYIDFEKKTGFACGAFTAYGFGNGECAVLLDATLGAELNPEQRSTINPRYLGAKTTGIDAQGLQSATKPIERLQFRFANWQSLVLSSVPLHYDAQWPPKSAIECVTMALAKPRGLDIWLALWKAESVP